MNLNAILLDLRFEMNTWKIVDWMMFWVKNRNRFIVKLYNWPENTFSLQHVIFDFKKSDNRNRLSILDILTYKNQSVDTLCKKYINKIEIRIIMKISRNFFYG